MQNENKMPALLRRYRQLYQESLDIKRALAEVEREMLSIGAPRRRRSGARRGARGVKEVVDVLRTSAEPMTARSIAERLGLSMGAIHGRLARAMEMQLIERPGRGSFRCVEPARRDG